MSMTPRGELHLLEAELLDLSARCQDFRGYDEQREISRYAQCDAEYRRLAHANAGMLQEVLNRLGTLAITTERAANLARRRKGEEE